MRPRAYRIGLYVPHIHLVCIYRASGAGGERYQVLERYRASKRGSGGTEYGRGDLLGAESVVGPRGGGDHVGVGI